MLYKLTVFTPTYNRAYILPKLYDSLVRQKNDDFEWLIVDDGSTDETESLVSKWISEQTIHIRYIKQPNGGKMRAHNKGAEIANSELFVCVDSDDYLADDAIKSIIEKWNQIKNKTILAGIIAYKSIYKNGKYEVITPFPFKHDTSLHDLYMNGFKGDTTLIFRTDVIRQFPFHVFDGEKFITEGVSYDLIDQNYKYALLDKGLTYCEYREDGYTQSSVKLAINNPRGVAYYYNQYIGLYKPSGKELIKKTSYYIAFSRLGKCASPFRESNTNAFIYFVAWFCSYIYEYKHLKSLV